MILFSTAHSALSCSNLFEINRASKSFAIDEQWKSYREPHPNISAVKNHVLALGHFTTYLGIFRIGKQGALKSRLQQENERKKSRTNLGGNESSSYLSPIGQDQRFIYVDSSLLGPTIIFTNDLLDRRDYYFNSGADYGVFNSPNSYVEPSGFRGSWDLDKLNKKNFPTEVVFENEISLMDYAAAIVVPSAYKHIFQSLSVLNGISWKKMGVEIIYSDKLPDSSILQELVVRKKANTKKELDPYDVHLNIRSSLDLHLPNLEDKFNYLENPNNWETELGTATRNYFMNNYDAASFEKKDINQVLRFLDIQLRTGSINWHWFEYYKIIFPDSKAIGRMSELLARYNYNILDLTKRQKQKIPEAMRLNLLFDKNKQQLPQEYQNL